MEAQAGPGWTGLDQAGPSWTKLDRAGATDLGFGVPKRTLRILETRALKAKKGLRDKEA